jgi:membrane protease YdiL (CAAX protease family)
MLLLARVGWQRALNRALGGGLWGKKKTGDKPVRRPTTTTKGAGSLPVTLFVVFVMLWLVTPGLLVGWLLGCTFIERLDDRLNGRERPAATRDADQGADAPASDPDRLFRSGDVWPVGGNAQIVTAAVALMLLVVSLGQTFTLLGGGKQDLGKTDWDAEWLFTFPVPARTLFLARLVQYAVGGPLQAMFFFLWAPFLSGTFWSAGFGWWSFPLALAAILYLSVLIGSLCLVTETWVQKRLAPDRRKNVQATFVLLGCVLGLLGVALYYSPVLDRALLTVAACVPGVEANPLSLPAALCHGGTAALAAGGLIVALVAAVPLGALRLAERLVRDGLVASSNAYQGSRGAQASGRRGVSSLLSGVVGKELLLLMRDRSFLVLTLLTPLLIGGFVYLMNQGTGTNLLRSPHHAAAVAFGLAVYGLAFSAFQVLATEGKSLWLLYTFPRRLDVILRQKTLLWAAVSSLHALVVFGVAVLTGMPLTTETFLAAAFALIGVVLFAFIVAAVGTLSADPAATLAEPRHRPVPLLFCYLLASVYSLAIYSGSLWVQLGQVILFALLAVALWQKVQDRIPYLLEPGTSPPPRLGLTHGLIAAVAFLNVQQIMVAVLAAATDLPAGVRWLVAFASAGAVVALGALFFLRKVPNLLATTGLILTRSEPRTRIIPALLRAALAGLLAGLFAVVYLLVINQFPVLRAWKDSVVPARSSGGLGSLIAVLAVYLVAAPVFEEFVFRGLLFQGMRRSMRPAFAIFASAAIFAVVHSPVAALPVFVLGVAAAFSFERSRWLLAPIVTHAVYNAVAVVAEWLM